MNEQIILANHLVTHRKHTIHIPLRSENNLLEMTALNTGNTPPNTAAFRIIDGTREQVIILKSDMLKSEAILIRRSRQ